MEYLDTQEQFEILIGRIPFEKPLPKWCIIYFTATWCGPCRSIKMDLVLQKTNPTIQWFKCDVDRNDYTPGFCNVKAIPTFMMIHEKKILGTLQSSDTEKIIAWIESVVPS
jgi:thioredoxin-like negative regulator of GroEL